MQATEVELKAQITALVKKAGSTDEAEKNEPDLDIPAEIERRQARLTAIEAAKARLEERQRQSDAQRGRTPDDDRQAEGQRWQAQRGQTLPARLRCSCAQSAGQLYRSTGAHHEACWWRV